MLSVYVLYFCVGNDFWHAGTINTIRYSIHFFKNVFIGKTNYFPCIVLHTENEFPSCAISKSNYCFQVLSLVFWNVNFIFDCLIFSFFHSSAFIKVLFLLCTFCRISVFFSLVFSSFIYPSKIQGKIPRCNVSTKRERIPVASEKIFLLRLLGEIMYDFMHQYFMHQLVFLLPKTLFDHGKRISTLGVLPSFSAFQWVSVLWWRHVYGYGWQGEALPFVV